jgi:hypothetical protein
MPDPNFPGMRVCKDDLDKFDPWRLPARQTENISLRFPRPDVSVALTPAQVMTEGGFTNQVNSMFIEGVPPVGGTSGDLSQLNENPSNAMTLNPNVGTITPNTGINTGGQPVNIFGSNFTDIATVRFGTTVAAFSLVSSTQIIAITPPHAVGVVNVSVLGPFGTGTAQNAFTYT